MSDPVVIGLGIISACILLFVLAAMARVARDLRRDWRGVSEARTGGEAVPGRPSPVGLADPTVIRLDDYRPRTWGPAA